MAAESESVEVTILGSGTSHGIPMIGCHCRVCTSEDPRDRRYRPSIYVRMGEQCIMVDTAPELRLQCIENNIRRLDAVLYTHHHADHVMGLDDLRRFNYLMNAPVRLYATEKTISSVEKMFGYAFDPNMHYPSSKPQLEWEVIDTEPFTVGDQTIVPIPLMHGPLPVRGFRFQNVAYCTDCNEISDEAAGLLEGLDVLILDALRLTPHPTHFNLEQAIEAARAINAKQTFFTHLTHEIDHQETGRGLPERMDFAYDGLRIVSNMRGI